MDQNALRNLADRFRPIAGNKASLDAMIEKTCKDNMSDETIFNFCKRLKDAANDKEVVAILDEVGTKSS